MIEIASSRAPRIAFEADGREREERTSNGNPISTRAVLYGEQLMVSTSGSPADEFTVTFDPIENGRRLRVTRRIYVEQLKEPVVVQSFYNKTSSSPLASTMSREQPRRHMQRKFPPSTPPSTANKTAADRCSAIHQGTVPQRLRLRHGA